MNGVFNPLSYFPHSGKDELASSPLGEVQIAMLSGGGEGFKNRKKSIPETVT
jgi:hypothetical protein